MPATVSTPTVLETKLHIPRWPGGLVARPALIERVRNGVLGMLTVVVAPAGFGKTTLLAEWLAHRGPEEPRVAWLSLDPADNEPTLFWTCIVRALQKVRPDLGHETMVALQAEGTPSVATLTEFLNEITKLDEGVVLVVDDYHVIETPGIHTALAFVLDHLPPRLHLVLATRGEPPLPLARMRSRGDLTELRSRDLRFTPDEAAAFFRTALSYELPAPEVAALEQRTEGWIAGLKLAALSIAERADVAGFIRGFSGDHRYVADYLVEEVLERQPERTRSFLLATSILTRLNASLCDAVTEELGSQAILDSLERRNLFVVPLDDRREWYRYHHLFAEVLHAHAMRDDPARVRALHRRAGAWYEMNGALDDAVHHAHLAEDPDRLAELLERHWPPKDRSYASRRWLDRVKSLPATVVAARPGLNMGFAWGLLNAGELEAAELRLAEVESSLDVLHSSPLSIEAATARVYLAQSRGDGPRTLEHARRVLALLPPDAHTSRATAQALLSLAQWAQGDLEGAHDTFRAALASMRLGGADLDALRGEFVLGDIRAMQGRLREAARIYERGIDLAAPHPSAETDELLLGLGEVRLELGRTEDAERILLDVEDRSSRAQHHGNRHRWCIVMSRIAQSKGDLDRALRYLEEAEANHRRDPLPIARPIAAMKARVRLAQGNVAAATRWAAEEEGRSNEAPSFVREYDRITLARVLMARDTPGEALESLRRLAASAEAGGRTGRLIEILVLEALACNAMGRTSEAFDAIARALELAEEEGHLDVFVAEGTPMRELLRHATARGIGGACARRVLAGFDPPSESPRDTKGQTLLTTREREILRLIAAGMRNQEIARQLFISPATVKRHIANVYGKLDAGHRTEALRRAAELDLL
jgi:LuxR family maltose regulon positive regulatory protein